MTRMNISVKNLKDVVDTLSTVVTEAKFKISQQGISVNAVDPAHVAMVSLEIPKGVLSEYDIDNEEELSMDLEKVKGILKLASGNDSFIITKDKEKLRFEIGNIIKSISLLDNNQITTPRVPQIVAEDYIVLNKGDLEKGLRAAEDVSDAIRLTMNPDSFSAKSMSDADESEMILPKDMLKEIQCKESIKSSYPLEYLLKFMKSVSPNEEIKLSFKSDYPLTIEFNLGTESPERIKGRFLLAPRMES
ncbi:MAG: DNA polymerase sliding clamp [Candidatus Thermoplasmatota archaeon]|jgi:proliferating cell nuclear antigen|uniref:DNA polymerase sliding clamp n=1 Tax=Ferroplasma sp. TaxID=2591003 RepID=UPI0026069F5F|nr:DNA polymerase sliding clamp [Ferroplasma sp.]MCL4311640.1 DNA polymerase sliding clamp [Candidatus Thermoplasmatota archaeon]